MAATFAFLSIAAAIAAGIAAVVTGVLVLRPVPQPLAQPGSPALGAAQPQGALADVASLVSGLAKLAAALAKAQPAAIAAVLTVLFVAASMYFATLAAFTAKTAIAPADGTFEAGKVHDDSLERRVRALEASRDTMSNSIAQVMGTEARLLDLARGLVCACNRCHARSCCADP